MEQEIILLTIGFICGAALSTSVCIFLHRKKFEDFIDLEQRKRTISAWEYYHEKAQRKYN